MNKTGPILSMSKDHVNYLNNKKAKNKTKQRGFQDDFENFKKKGNNNGELKANLTNNKQGFTLGIKPSQVDYRKSRKNKLKQINNELNELFKTNIVFYNTGKKEKRIKKSSTSSKKSPDLKQTTSSFKSNNRNNSVTGVRTFFNQKKEKSSYEDLYKKALENRKQLEEEKLENLAELKEKQKIQYEEFLEKMKEKNETRKRASASRPRIKKVVTYPKLVNIAKGFVNDKTKFTMAGRTKQEFTYSKYDPSFRKIESDIEFKLKHPNLR
jgi:hypothetical protein